MEIQLLLVTQAFQTDTIMMSLVVHTHAKTANIRNGKKGKRENTRLNRLFANKEKEQERKHVRDYKGKRK